MTRLPEGVLLCKKCPGKKCERCKGRGYYRHRKKNKYNNRLTVLDGEKFASKQEADYYAHLKLLQKVGEVISFQLQPRYELVPGVTYVGDFLVEYKDGSVALEDVKGATAPLTDVFKLKAKVYGWRRSEGHPWPSLWIVKKIGKHWERELYK